LARRRAAVVLLCVCVARLPPTDGTATAHGRRAEPTAERCARPRPGCRQRLNGRSCDNARKPGGVVFARPRGGDSAGTGRPIRTEPGGSGNLWRGLLRGVTANRGNRPADVARRRVAGHIAADDQAGAETDADRRWDGRNTRAGAITLAVTSVDRRKRGGSGDVSRGPIVADSGRGVRLLDPGAASDEGRSDDCAAL